MLQRMAHYCMLLQQRAAVLRRDPSSAARRGVMEIRLRNGARVRVEADVDGEALRLVLATLSEL
jgi:transposase